MKRKHASAFNDSMVHFDGSGAQIQSRVITKETFRQKVISFIVCSDQPYTIVENQFFVDLIDYCSGGNDNCKLFSAKTAAENISKLFDDKKASMKTTILEKSVS